MSCRRSGFSLVEVMAAVMLLAIALVVMLGQRDQAISSAAGARDLSIASRLALQLLHRIECARVSELFDGYQGDFSEEGFPDFTYVVGVGDASNFAAGLGESSAEQAWRDELQRRAEEREDQEDEDGEESKPELTRVFVTVVYPGRGGDPGEYHLESLVPTWAVEQDFELYETKWGANLPKEVE
ncbi:MAG: prepilin-type N-terminal cleavage/methylation domain-containing protein [Planctomycetota bacterium]|nr:MAG: prepilin-type N-terminal cleavage/methylation domain-containing protein [Planctomycetota bacterium]